ncbi:hypothetical protein D9M69_298260 [compost metagenome]
MQLQALVDHLGVQVRAEQLGRGRRLGAEGARQALLHAAVDVVLRHRQLHLQVGELEAGVLELEDRLAEHGAAAGVVEGVLEHRERAGDAADGDRQALPGQFLHQVDEALALDAAEQVFLGYAAVLEEQHGGVLGVQADLLQRLGFAEAGAVGLDQGQRDVLGALAAGAGLRHHDHQVAVGAVGDEGLGAVDHVLVAVQHRAGLHRLQVGTGVRLGHRHGADRLAGGHLRQPLLLLRLGGEVDQVAGDDVVHAEADQPRRLAGAVDLFGGDHRETPIQAQAAVGFRGGGVEHAELAGALPDGARHAVIGFPLLQVRSALLRQEAPHGIAELLVLMVEQGAWNHRGLSSDLVCAAARNADAGWSQDRRSSKADVPLREGGYRRLPGAAGKAHVVPSRRAMGIASLTPPYRPLRRSGPWPRPPAPQELRGHGPLLRGACGIAPLARGRSARCGYAYLRWRAASRRPPCRCPRNPAGRASAGGAQITSCLRAQEMAS